MIIKEALKHHLDPRKRQSHVNSKFQDVAGEFAKLGFYFATVLLGLGIHGCLVLPILFGLITRSLPFRLYTSIFFARSLLSSQYFPTGSLRTWATQ